tara:strand:+ start:452 stop:631 length:180 start_codon:yes stop_codon:yes gene_type:complete
MSEEPHFGRTPISLNGRRRRHRSRRANPEVLAEYPEMVDGDGDGAQVELVGSITWLRRT